MAVMLARGDLALEAEIVSDTAPLNDLVEHLLSRRALDPVAARRHPGRRRHGLQRAGPATATSPSCSTKPPCPSGRRSAAACELLGIDPLYVANEGKFVAVVAPDEADAALAALRAHPLGRDAVGDRARSARSRPASSCWSPPSGEPGSSTCWSAIRCPGSAEHNRMLPPLDLVVAASPVLPRAGREARI